jgi:hypothetical protein
MSLSGIWKAFGSVQPKQAKPLNSNGRQIKTRVAGLFLYLFCLILPDYFGKAKLKWQCSEVL